MLLGKCIFFICVYVCARPFYLCSSPVALCGVAGAKGFYCPGVEEIRSAFREEEDDVRENRVEVYSVLLLVVLSSEWRECGGLFRLVFVVVLSSEWR